MTGKDNGHFVPEIVAEQLIDQIRQPLDERIFPRPTYVPTVRTRREAFRLYRASVRLALHDWLFPEYRLREDDDERC